MSWDGVHESLYTDYQLLINCHLIPQDFSGLNIPFVETYFSFWPCLEGRSYSLTLLETFSLLNSIPGSPSLRTFPTLVTRTVNLYNKETKRGVLVDD